MAGGPDGKVAEGRGASPDTAPAGTCRRLRLATVLLAIVGALGLVTAVLVVTSPAGEGLDVLLSEKEASVMGQVRDADGMVIQGAVVTCEDGGENDVTGASGWYFLEDLETGKSVLRMEAPGYKTVLKTVHLERGRYTVDFLAEPGTGTVELEGTDPGDPADPGAGTWLMASAIAVASLLALLGAWMSYLQRSYRLVVLGSLCGIMTWGWFAGSVLAVLALILVLPLRREFGGKVMGGEVPWHTPPPPDMEASEEDEDAVGETAFDVSPSGQGPPGRQGPGGMPPG